MNLVQGLIAGVLALVLPLVPSVAEAPEPQAATASASASHFDLVGDGGFSFRWVEDDVPDTGRNDCALYNWCAFIDLVGPSCPDQVFVALDYYDSNDELIASGGDVWPAYGRSRLIHVELGTSMHEGPMSFRITDIACYLGLPTGQADL